MFENLDTGGVKGKYRIIEEASMEYQYPVTQLCRLLGVWRSGYYRYLTRKKQNPDGQVKQQIEAIYLLRERKYGYRRIMGELLRLYHSRVNHKRVLRLMQQIGIKSIIRRKRVYFNQYQASASDGRVAENLLDRNFKAAKPNQKWVTDITQYRVGDERLYLSAVMDLCGKDIVAFNMSLRNDNDLVLRTFAQAFEKHKDVTGLVVHSDQGSQYTSHAYHDMLPTVGAQISMSRRGNCLDNAAMESFFSHLKVEGLYPHDIRPLKRHNDE